MSNPQGGCTPLVQSLAALLRNSGDIVLNGSSTLTLQAASLQYLTRLFEQFLLSRKHQHGFLALPSHPADTASLLQVQFLFDMLQKTVSLKLVNPLGSKLQSPVKILPFKSLKCLELKRIPPHCLEGLRAVYSQLEVFICSRSTQSLEELLSLCGGDISSALPWLELHTLNFSYNAITALDNSLSLLNVLKYLDLSHNKIHDCEEYLLPLSELEHLNLGYNFLQTIPVLSLSCRTKLVSLILRNNELESINGVEHLSSLRHLDLSYNILIDHSKLAPLSQLHSLNTLSLDGNPLFFHWNHRCATIFHLSSKAAFLKFKLDGCFLSSSELGVLPKSGPQTGQSPRQSSQDDLLSDRLTQEVSSGGGDMSDSLSQNEIGASKLSRKRSKNKIKVRRPSISEPSDTEHDSQRQDASSGIFLRHKKAIEKMDNFRDQMGEDWLRFKHHLEGDQDISIVTEPGPPLPSQPFKSQSDTLSKPITEPNTKTPELLESRYILEDPDTSLKWDGLSHNQGDNIQELQEPTLEESIQDFERELTTGAHAVIKEEDDYDELEVDLCHPLVVGIESGSEASQSYDTRLFLRVTPRYAVEVDLKSAHVLDRLELERLSDISTSQAIWKEKDREEDRPVLELHFSYLSRPSRKRRYILLDENPKCALQSLMELFSNIIKENLQKAAELAPKSVTLQCLKCKLDFSLPKENKQMVPLTRGEMGVSGNDTSIKAVCPACTSDHVVQLPTQIHQQRTSSPIPKVPQVADSPNSSSPHSNLSLSSDTGIVDKSSEVHEESILSSFQTDSFFSGKAQIFDSGETEIETVKGNGMNINTLPSLDILDSATLISHSADHTVPIQKNGFFSSGLELGGVQSKADSLAGSYSYNPQLAPKVSSDSWEESCITQYNLFPENFQTVDHRLQLFFDVEVFEDNLEDLQCFLKLSTVKYGDPEEFLALFVVSNKLMYILEITSIIQGQPSDWLRKHASHRISELRCVEVGLGSQTIHLEFDKGHSYTLIIRDSTRCKTFFSQIIENVQEFAPKCDSKLVSISTSRIGPHHHLWPIICENADMVLSEDSKLQYFYLLAYLCQDGMANPITVLATQDCLHLLHEDHQWTSNPPPQTVNTSEYSASEKVKIQDTQQISCVSSVHLFQSNPCRVDINLYDETAKEEKTWCLQTESPAPVQELVEWIRIQWEAMFGVKLSSTLH
ncbi:serine/threonine-protein kinase 11-interacting protein isoform X1 [Erpetoichthys calabaricus]|nr:serine/threonine-protein kinase 11-interacting protein isoform X1 [Erpetoichthys calabaricus]